MNGNQHEVVALEKLQRKLKKEIKTLKKRMPYYIIGFLFFGFIIFGLFDNNLNKYVGNSVNLFIVIGIISCSLCLIYLIITSNKIANRRKESKELGSKLYRIMKLEKSS
jgi:DMSO/TMAO reductase YedYZ heme-binding membrane subunit